MSLPKSTPEIDAAIDAFFAGFFQQAEQARTAWKGEIEEGMDPDWFSAFTADLYRERLTRPEDEDEAEAFDRDLRSRGVDVPTDPFIREAARRRFLRLAVAAWELNAKHDRGEYSDDAEYLRRLTSPAAAPLPTDTIQFQTPVADLWRCSAPR